MADIESQKNAWRQTTDSLRNDLEIPMDVIATQSQTLVKNWMNGFSQMMFDGVTYNKNGLVDFSKELTPRMMNVSYSALENGVVTQKKIEMPLLGAVQYPAVELDTINLKLSYSVDTTNENKNNSSMENTAEVGVNGSFFGFGVKSDYSLKMTQTEERTRKTDTRASLTLDANYSRLPQGEAISRLADVLMNNATATGGNADAEK
ncbi:DUF2589 domain-containing protein [Salmonella enterica]|nr:DUF2589 domain-containing protein [Salmonella enterica]EIP6687070.1 DUF2589 domain-containing protein [Salmonella enterica subsp. enterica serovar Javiana]EIP6742416.1 DUF2589 domain-containing protein [Salmonella enterica subsp. enterica serovar Javiana]EIQ4670021.1 DUF2589 domain-containing protein [Salmonella enterica subsp. enterica serovar Javiana]EIR2402415.1 DUF2589 domain-containing protein [Salmonella enterica subsp. enterica serovar Javiana]